MAGVVWLGLRVVRNSIQVKRWTAGLKPVCDPDVLGLLDECRRLLRVRARLRVAESPTCVSPALQGLVRPRLLLPEGFREALSERQLRFVLLHELAHVKRRDIALNWLVALLQILHWFNPLLWWGFGRWRTDRELACDALALEAAGPEQNQEYGRTILRLLERANVRLAAPGWVGIVENKRQLRARIGMIAGFTRPARWSGLVAGALMVAVAILGLTDADDKPRNQTARTDGIKPDTQHEPASPRPDTATAGAVVATNNLAGAPPITEGPSLKVTVLDANTGEAVSEAAIIAPNQAGFYGSSANGPTWFTHATGVATIRLGNVPAEAVELNAGLTNYRLIGGSCNLVDRNLDALEMRLDPSPQSADAP